MTTEEIIQLLETSSKDDFIKYAKKINILKTLKEPNYLLLRDKILNLLPKHDLNEIDVYPDPRRIKGNLEVKIIK